MLFVQYLELFDECVHAIQSPQLLENIAVLYFNEFLVDLIQE